MDCYQELEKLKKQFVKLLIANGEIMQHEKKHNNNNNFFYDTSDGIEQELYNMRFSKSVIPKVAYQMRRHGRPSSDFSKKTGLIKKS